MSKNVDAFREKLEKFKSFLDIVRGNQDIKTRANLILDPTKVETSTKLTGSQVDFVSTSIFVAEYFPELKPLADFAREFAYISASLGGWGVDKVIQYEQAINEKRMMQLGLKPQGTVERIKETIKTNATKE